jgi:purine-binding chemotaxis protein CheW
MVDLVKIRRKKAEKKKADEEAAQQKAELETVAGTPVAEASASSDVPAAVPGGTPTQVDRVPAGESPQHSPADAAVSTPRPGKAAALPDMPVLASTSKLDKYKQDAGQRRAVVATRDEDGGAQQLEALTFVMAGEQYAVDIERIVEIVTPRPITRIPNADPSVVGIMSLRGTIVTLLDVRRKLGHRETASATADTRIVVIEQGNETIGFAVDRVLRVVKTAAGDVEPHPVVHAGELNEAIRGVFRIGNALTILLDLDKLLDHNALAARSA